MAHRLVIRVDLPTKIKVCMLIRFYKFNANIFVVPNQNHFGWDYSGSSNMEELQLILEECIMIR